MKRFVGLCVIVCAVILLGVTNPAEARDHKGRVKAVVSKVLHQPVRTVARVVTAPLRPVVRLLRHRS